MRVARSLLTVAILAANQACAPITEPEKPEPPTIQTVDYKFSTVIDDMVFPRGILRFSKDSVTNVRSDTTIRAVVRIGADSSISFVLDIGVFNGRLDPTGYILGTYSSSNVTGRWFAQQVLDIQLDICRGTNGEAVRCKNPPLNFKN